MKKFVRKLLVGASLFLTVSALPLTSCSLFGEDGFVITSISSTYDESGNVVVTILTTSEETPVLTFTVSAGLAGEDGVSIVNVEGQPGEDGNSIDLIFYYSDNIYPPTTINVPVIRGEDGRGVENIEVVRDANENLVITFYYTDGTKQGPYTIPRGVPGKDGKDGVGILNIQIDQHGDPDNVIVIINYTDSAYLPTIIKIPKGVGIASITYDEETSTIDEYSLLVTYSNGKTSYITIPRPKSSEWFTGEDAPASTIGKDGDFYLNVVNGFVYQKKNGSWNYLLCMKGTGSAVNFLVKFYPSEGSWSDGSTDTIAMVVDYGEYIDINNIPTPVRDNYVFNGWWTTQDNNPNAGHFTDLTPVLKDMNLYPRWIEE